MRDHEIQALCGRALQNIKRGHHGHSNAGDRRIRIASFESIDGFLLPRNSNMLLNSGNHFARRGLFALRRHMRTQ